jgi:hypothetical protein
MLLSLGIFQGHIDALQPLRRVTETTFRIFKSDFIETSFCDILTIYKASL